MICYLCACSFSYYDSKPYTSKCEQVTTILDLSLYVHLRLTNLYLKCHSPVHHNGSIDIKICGTRVIGFG